MKTPLAIYPLLFSLLSTQALADSAWGLTDEHTKRWRCKFCQFEASEQQWFSLNFGYLDEDAFRFGNINGIEQGSQLYPRFHFSHFDGEDKRWRLNLDAQSLDSFALDFNLQRYNQWQVKGGYQEFALKQYQNLYSPFHIDDDRLTLAEQWQPLASMTQLTPVDYYHTDLQSNWQQFDLGLRLNTQHFNYAIDYNRIEQSGIKAASTAQMLNAFYLPQAIDHSTDNLALSASAMAGGVNYQFGYSISKFNNQYDGYWFEVPYQPLLDNATSGQLAAEPDNLAYQFNGNLQYRTGSQQFKLYAAFATHKQDTPLLPYTTNSQLSMALPTSSPNLKVSSKQLRLSYHNRLSAKLSVDAKYRMNSRDNRSTQWQFTPVINDVYVAGEINNVLYDYINRELDISAKYRFGGGRFAKLTWLEDKKRRNYQYQSKVRDEGYSAVLHLPLAEFGVIRMKAERFERGGKRWQIIDLVEQQQSPLTAKFYESDRKQKRYSLSYSLPYQALDFQLSAAAQDNDHLANLYGLQSTRNHQLDFAINWHLTSDTLIGGFINRQTYDARYNAQSTVTGPFWHGLSKDAIDGYGAQLQLNELFSLPLKLQLSWQQSNSDSDMQTEVLGVAERLPRVSSDWAQTELALTYHYSEQWQYALQYRHDRLQSADFALDLAVPGNVRNLLGFGQSSYNYRIDYIVISLQYSF